MRRRTHIRRAARAFTLIEVLASGAIMSIVFLALASTVVIATRALPSPDDPTEATLTAAEVVHQLDSDLRFAQEITTLAQTAIGFTVPDRDGDTSEETLMYVWSGTPGDPLELYRNADPPRRLAANVREFSVSLEAIATTTGPDQPPTILISDDPTETNSIEVTSATWVAWVFSPALPPDATEWRIESVELTMNSSGSADGVTTAQLRSVDALGMPSGSILAETTILEWNVPNRALVAVSFPDAPWVAASEKLAIVFFSQSNPPSLRLFYRNDPANPPGEYTAFISLLSGLGWVVQPVRRSDLIVRGSVLTPGGVQSIGGRASVSLRLNNDGNDAVVASIPLLNRPAAP